MFNWIHETIQYQIVYNKNENLTTQPQYVVHKNIYIFLILLHSSGYHFELYQPIHKRKY